jgi:hypothetical protein
MSPTVEQQIKEKRPTGELPITNTIEGAQPAQRVETEKTTQVLPKQEETVPQGPNPQTLSAIRNDFVEDKGAIAASTKTEWGSELIIKAGGKFGVDITKVSNN